jgi:hypothetical protein
MRRTVVALITVAILIAACTPEQPPAATASASPATVTASETASSAPIQTSSPAATESAQSAQCPAIVAQALTAVDTACQRTGRNQICYGNVQLSAEFNEGVGALAFASPGDIADLSAIKTVDLSPLDAVNSQWGLALMRVQANLPDTLPGQNVTFLLFGDVELENVTEKTGIPSSFYFRTGIGDSTCSEAPSSGILVQTPDGVSEVTLRMNGVDIALGSTAYLQAQPGSDMTVSVIEGKAAVEAQGELQIVTAGSRSNIPMSDDLIPAGPPSPPTPYEAATLQNLPVNNLERQISVESVLVSIDFLANAEGWTSVNGGTPVEHRTDEPASDGAVCSTGRVFIAPQSWLGNRSAAFGGSLGLVARQTEGTAPDVLLEGGGISLNYVLPEDANGEWRAFTVPFDAAAGWINSATGAAATPDALRSALVDLTVLHVRGLGGCIDYVQLTAPVASTTPYRRAAAVIPTAVTTAGTQQTFDIAIGDEIAPDSSQVGIGEIDGLSGTDEYRFEAQAGQQVYFAARGEEGAVIWSLIAPDGTVLFDRWRLWQGNDPGIVALPQTGTYTLRVTGESNRVGTYRFALSAVGEGETFAISPDVRVFEDNPAPGAGRIESAGERDIYTFTLDAPQEIYFAAMGEESRIEWTLTGPDGEPIFEGQRLWQGNDPGAFAFDAGEYLITVSGDGDSTGRYEFSVWLIPPPQTFTLPLDTLVGDGVPETGMGRIETPGAQDIYTLELTDAAELRFAALGEESRALWTLIAPDGTPLFEDQRLWTGNTPGVFALDPGIYTVTVRGDMGQTGAYRFSVTYVEGTEAAAASDSILIEAEDEIAAPGQQFDYAFEAAVGQTILLDIRLSDLSTYWTLTGPDEAKIFNSIRSGVSSLGPYVLEQAGEYTLSIAGYAEETGPYSFALWNVPAPDAFDIPLGSVIGPEVGSGAGAIETPGVQDTYTFDAAAGSSVFIEVPEADFTAYWLLADYDGTQVFAGFRSGGSNLGLIQLERGGAYTLTVSGYQAETGTYRARIWEVPAPDTFAVEIGQTIAVETTGAGAGSIESPGVQDIYTFDAAPGQSILVEVLEANFTVYWQLTGPADEQIFSGYRSGDSILGIHALESSGQYTLTVSGYDAKTGTYRAKIWDVPEPDRFETEIGQPIPEDVDDESAGVIETPGVQDVYSFEAAPGQSILIEVLEADFTVYWQLIGPEGTQIFSGYRGANNSLGVLVLENGGQYTLTVSGYNTETGTYRAKIWDVPEPDRFEIAIGQSAFEDTPEPGAGEIETPGVQDIYTFAAAQGQTIQIEITSADFTVYWVIEHEDGEQIFGGYRGANSIIGPITLERAGPYRLVVSGYDRETGPYRFTISEP